MTDKENQFNLQNVRGEPPALSKLWMFQWLYSRWALLAGAILLGIILVVFGNSSSQASLDRSAPAIRQPKNLFSPQAYQFTGQGIIQAGSAETWIVGGVPILVGRQTQTEGEVHPGGSVSLVGHITESGGWVAERIVSISEDESFFTFAGPLESKDRDSWQVAGVTLALNGYTRLGDAIPLGEIVLATFQVQPDGSWLALQIQALSTLELSRTPTITPTPEPTPTPSPTAKRPTDQIQKPPVSDDKPADQNSQVTVCHNPSKKQGGKTIVLDSSALSSHLGHGDTLGPCR